MRGVQCIYHRLLQGNNERETGERERKDMYISWNYAEVTIQELGTQSRGWSEHGKMRCWSSIKRTWRMKTMSDEPRDILPLRVCHRGFAGEQVKLGRIEWPRISCEVEERHPQASRTRASWLCSSSLLLLFLFLFLFLSPPRKEFENVDRESKANCNPNEAYKVR